MGLIKIKVPLLSLLLSAGVFLSLGLFLNRKPIHSIVSEKIIQNFSPTIETFRKKDGRLIEPLLMFDVGSEPASLSPLKSIIEQYIQRKETAGDIKIASVYFRDLNSSKSFSINPSEQYMPASIMKLPILITYLKEAETHPGLLQQKIFFGKHFAVIPEQTMTNNYLQENRNFTVDELLQSMIINSDNDATALLNQNINLNSFKVLFRILSLAEPDIKQWNYNLTVAECSRFLQLLFNSTYLNEKNSEYAVRLLTQTNYKEGFVKLIDPELTIAHKFGERNVANEQQLHETGIFYLDDKPYLLTVMTKGNDRKLLPVILADISQITLTYLKGKGV